MHLKMWFKKCPGASYKQQGNATKGRQRQEFCNANSDIIIIGDWTSSFLLISVHWEVNRALASTQPRRSDTFRGDINERGAKQRETP